MNIQDVIANAQANLVKEEGAEGEKLDVKKETTDGEKPEDKQQDNKTDPPEKDKGDDGKTPEKKEELSEEEKKTEKSERLMRADYTKKTMALAEDKKAYQKMSDDMLALGKNPEALAEYFKSQGVDIQINKKVEDESSDIYKIDKEFADQTEIENAENINKAFREQKKTIDMLTKENESFNSHLIEQKNKGEFKAFEKDFNSNREAFGLPKDSLGIVTAIYNEGQKQWGAKYTLAGAMADVARVATGGLSTVEAVDKNEKLSKELKEKYIAEYLAKKEKDRKDSSLPSSKSSGTKESPPKDIKKKRKTIEQVLEDGRKLFGLN